MLTPIGGGWYNTNRCTRGCWNRQTGTFEVRVSNDVWVQVPFLAPEKAGFKRGLSFSFCADRYFLSLVVEYAMIGV